MRICHCNKNERLPPHEDSFTSFDNQSINQSITEPLVRTEQVSTILINKKYFCLSHMYENGTTRRDMREGTHTLKFAPSLDSHGSSAIISNKFIKIVTARLRNYGSVMFSDVCLSVCLFTGDRM